MRPHSYCPSTRQGAPRSLATLAGQCSSPGGRFDNSPAVHCRVQIRVWIRPDGTTESRDCYASAPRIEHKEWNLWERFSRPFGTRRPISTVPPLKGWAILNSPSGRELPESIARKAPHLGRTAADMECAGRAQRRRRFGLSTPTGRAIQSGVALRLPPHSKAAGLLRLMEADEASVLPQLRRAEL